MRALKRIPATLCLLGALVCSRAEALVWTPQTNHVRTVHLLTNLVTDFQYTNTSSSPVTIVGIERSCHCTTPKTPELPWTIAPHASGKMEVIVEVPGKWGLLQKTISMRSATQTNILLLQVDIAEPDTREKNRLMAFADRQAVFKGDCAST